MADVTTVDERPVAVSDDEETSVAEQRAAKVSVNDWLRQRTVPQVLIAAAVVGYTAYFTQRSLDIHHGLGTASYDSALYDQGMWLLSRFDAPFVTLMGRNMFGDHTSFVLLFLVPLYWIAPGAWIMFFAQSAAIAGGSIPVFLYGRSRLGSEWFALVLATAYLLHPALGWTNLENFHPDSFLGVFLGFAIYGALERKWRVYGVFVVLSLLVKEDVSLVVVPLGIWVGLRRDRRIGLITIFGALWFMFTAMFVVMRGLIGVPTRNNWRIPFGGPRGVIDTALTNPTDLANHLRAENRPWYVWQMTAPFAWVFLRLPSVAAISALVLFTNILSTFWYQHQVEYHYGLVAVPALAMGTVYAIGAMRERVEVMNSGGLGADADGHRADSASNSGCAGGTDEASAAPVDTMMVPIRGLAVAAVATTALVAATMWGPVPWGRTPLYYGQPDNVYAVTMRELIDEIPDEASVAAHYRVTPHLAYRTEIYQFPNPFRVDLYGVDDNLVGSRLVDRAERIQFVILPTSLDESVHEDWAVVEAAFVEVASNQFWVLYQRDPNVTLP